MDNLMMLIFGLFISVLGIMNMRGNISSIHSYNRRRVRQEDVPKYGKVVGIGTLIIGIALILSFITLFWTELLAPYILGTAALAGLGFILYGQFKYNGGLF